MQYTYKILSTKSIENVHYLYEYDAQGNELPNTSTYNTTTVKTEVEYDFEDYGKHVIVVSHFNPKDETVVKRGIENRAITEIKKLSK